MSATCLVHTVVLSYSNIFILTPGKSVIVFSSNCSSYFFVVLHCLPALFLVYFSIFCLRFSFITNSYVVIIAWASFCVVEQYNQYDMYMLCFSSVFLKHGIFGVIWFIKTSTQISLCSCIIYFLSFLSVRFLFLENEEEKWKVLPHRVLLSFQSIVQIFFFFSPMTPFHTCVLCWSCHQFTTAPTYLPAVTLKWWQCK